MKNIVELTKKVIANPKMKITDNLGQALLDKIAELEGNQAKRDLMMKAQGVSELAETMIFRGHLQNTLSYDEVCDFSKELLKQAGDL